MITTTITTNQILALQAAADRAGDVATWNDCWLALGGYDSTCTPSEARAWQLAARERIAARLAVTGGAA